MIFFNEECSDCTALLSTESTPKKSALNKLSNIIISLNSLKKNASH